VLLLANVAYVLMLLAFVTRDVLRLRSVLVVAQVIVVFYTWQSGVTLIAGWNAAFVCINAAMAVQIVRERRSVRLPGELVPLYERHFAALSPPEFLRWWQAGERETLANQALTRAGTRPEWLYFLLKGSVRVTRGADTVVELPAGHFVAEMSVLTGEPANADVDAGTPVEVMRWPRALLEEIHREKPADWVRIQSVIGLDLVRKINLWERLATASEARESSDTASPRGRAAARRDQTTS
jgi:CRP-like cAMP-binding protein